MAKHEDISISNRFLILLILLVISVTINLYFITSLNLKLSEKVAAEKEAARPANIQVLKITDASCKECSVETALSGLQASSSLKITDAKSIDASSSEAKFFIYALGIKRLPALVLKGEVEKTSAAPALSQLKVTKFNSSLSFIEAVAPYVDVASGATKGKVASTLLVDSSCSKCFSMKTLVSNLKNAGVFFSSEREIEYNTQEGKELISKYGVQKVPAIIISKDVLEYEAVAQVWPSLNATEKDGNYALHATSPPYRDLNSSTIRGLVDLIMLSDKSCSSCYDVSVHKQILSQFGITINNESSYDLSDSGGTALIAKYNITKAPTVLISPDAELYSLFVQVWSQVGDRASDKWYVFRTVNVMGTYKDLSSGSVITPSR